MLLMQHKQSLQSIDDFFVACKGRFRSKSHPQEVSYVAKLLVRLDDWLVLVDSQASSSNCWHLANHPVDVDIPFFLSFIPKLTAIVGGVCLRMARR